MANGLFITGTGTGVGKTYVAALIARLLRAAGVRVGVYKPVASGCEVRGGRLVSPDAVTLWQAAGQPGMLEQVCPQTFALPLAPHLAARAEGRDVDAGQLRSGIDFWRTTSEFVLVEGAGGLMSPVSEHDYNLDLAEEFGLPLVVVAVNELGTLNATLQTLLTASARGRKTREGGNLDRDGLAVAGVVLNAPRRLENDPSIESNADELARRCAPPLLAVVAHGGGFDRAVDWQAVAKPSATA